MGQSLVFRLFVVKIGQALDIGPKVVGIQRALEDGPAFALGIVRSSEGIKRLDPDPLPIGPMPAVPEFGFGAGQRRHGLRRPIGRQKAFCNPRGDGRVGAFFR